jgi:GntR family transcriptional regulator, transcriptional repressor for pyruvate dehydrogenase complex
MGRSSHPEELPVTDPMIFAPIARQTVSAQVREQLLRRIVTGDLAPGARVPSERELSEQFEVARTSVREAIQGLLSLGYIERRGNRTWVPERLPEVTVHGGVDEQAFLSQLFETRRLLEAPIFALAAERSDVDDHTAVSALLARFDEPLTLAEFRRLDREFHNVIASACGNPLLIELYRKVLDQLFRSWPYESPGTEETATNAALWILQDSLDRRRAIVDALQTGDPIAMERAVASHLDTIEQSMIAERRLIPDDTRREHAVTSRWTPTGDAVRQ